MSTSSQQILNSCLPATIRIISWCPVVPDFNARFACNSRRYHYFFTRGDYDIKLMQVASPPPPLFDIPLILLFSSMSLLLLLCFDGL
jgi:tRNA U38,U39,U40 pseudouridine synthase TruA